MNEDLKARVLAQSEIARVFDAAGGFEAADVLQRAAVAAGTSCVVLVQLCKEDDPDDALAHLSRVRVLEDATVNLQCAALAAQDRLEDLATGLALALGEEVSDEGNDLPLHDDDAGDRT
jgi:hypothetical protein